MHRRTRWQLGVALGLALGIMGCGGAGDADAVREGPPVEPVMEVYSSPVLETTELEKAVADGQVAPLAEEPDEAVPASGAEAEELALADGAEYAAQLDATGALEAEAIQAAAPSYDYITTQECLDTSAARQRRGWIKNHFAYCVVQNHGILFNDCWFPGFRCRASVITFQTVLLGYGKKGERKVEFDLTVRNLRTTGVFATGRLGVSMECRGGNCVVGQNGKDVPVVDWRLQPTTHFELTSAASSALPANGEQVVRASFTPRLSVRGGDFRKSWAGYGSGIRFDSAWYLAPSVGAIFDRTTPSLEYSFTRDTTMTAAIWHMRDALLYPGSTYPTVSNKTIPGGAGNRLIHRLYHDKKRIEDNTDEAHKVCNERWPGYTLFGQDCDEFPFKTTYEGAAQYRYDTSVPYGRFSAKAIDASPNQASGRKYGTWFSSDRILDGDGFFIRISP